MTPICLFTYNRLKETKKAIEALQNNFLAVKSNLIIFSDGPKNNIDNYDVTNLREYLQTIKGFKSVKVIESKKNKGLANSIIEGVSKLLEIHESVIVLEDDLITAPNFLNFMNDSLQYFKENERVFSVTGWSLPLKVLNEIETKYYFNYRMSSWGWGIWKDRWSKIKWENEHYDHFNKDHRSQRLFKRGGNDLPRMLKNYLKGKNNSWAIRACYHQFQNNLLTVAPKLSKVNNIGFGEQATHTKHNNRFDQNLDSSLNCDFDFESTIVINERIIKEFKNTFSLHKRIKSKLLTYVNFKNN